MLEVRPVTINNWKELAALKVREDQNRADGRVKAIAISYDPNNDAARTLYAKFGFQETGEMVDGEALALLSLR